MLHKSQSKDGSPPGAFSFLDDKERIRLFNAGTIRTLAEKEVLHTNGTPGKTIYCVLSGSLGISRDAESNAFRFNAGDLFEERSLPAPGNGKSSVLALESSSVLCLSPAAFLTLEAKTQAAILKTVCDRTFSRTESLSKQKETAQFREAALTRYVKKCRKPLDKYEQSEIIVNIVKNIPKLPLYLTHLLELLTSEIATAKEVAALAKQDPSLVIDILKVINSPRYALQTEVSDVSYAITYMGFNEVYQIATSRGMMKSMPNSDDFTEIYHHSLLLSYIAAELCQSCDKNKAPLLSTIGLLHDIGEAVILLLRKQNPKWSLFIDMLDSSKLGAMLLKQWNIPQQICRIVEHQAYPEFCPPEEIPRDQQVNIALLYVAHTVCDHLHKAPVDARDHPYLDDYLHLLGFNSGGIEQVARHNILQGLMAKSQRLPQIVVRKLTPGRSYHARD